MISAVIFDMDGLLVDSEHIGITVMQEGGRKQGIEMATEVILQNVGTTYLHSKEVYGRYYPALNVEQLFAYWRTAMLQKAAKGEIPLKAGARELLAFLKQKGIPMAVASSSTLDAVNSYLQTNGVLPYFDVLVGGKKGLSSKPAPDIFLYAAQQLGVQPENCLVLEDSVNGIKAGRAAGMQVCMVPDLFPFSPELAPYCDAVKQNLAEVISLVTASC